MAQLKSNGGGVRSVQRGTVAKGTFNIPIERVNPEKCVVRFWVQVSGNGMINSEVMLAHVVHAETLTVTGAWGVNWMSGASVASTQPGGYRWELIEYV